MVSKSYHCFMIGDGKPCELADTIQPYFFMYPSSYQCFACHSVRKTLTFHYPAIEDSMRKLKIDASMKVNSINVSGAQGASQSDSISCISSGDATSSIKETEVDQEPLMGDQGMHYYGYYYPGSAGFLGEWDDRFCVQRTDNLQVQHPGIQADNGSVIYYFPGYQAGYTPYSPLLPGAMYGVDGQFLSQSYCPNLISPQALVSPGPLPQQVAYGPELVPAYPWDPSFFFADEIQGSRFAVDPTKPHYRPNLSSEDHTLAASRTFPASKSALGTKGSSLVSDMSHPTMIHNQSQKPTKKASAAVLSKGYDPVNKFNAYVNQGKGPLFYPSSIIDMKENGQSWVDDVKLKVRNKLNSCGDLDLLNEQNRGPRTNGNKSTSQVDIDSLKTLDDKNDGDSISVAIINKDEYNRPDFQTKYEHALFFVIKSYSEDDIHKSIKYSVWASTPNGNKRVDNAFQVAQEKMAEKGSNCPVFLLFSVNASGQFCGVAEMTGRVDFGKNMDFWQQDKWNGFFPVKWHIIKDVPNLQFRHIILENNDNKPVTNSRDTQEVKFSQGIEMLSIFKSHSSKTSILDDFGFYENRQKAMQDKRNKPTTPPLVNSLPKNVESTKVPKLGDSKSQPPDLVSVEVKEGLRTGIASRK